MSLEPDMTDRSIVCFAREAGGAEAIAPVVKLLQEKRTVYLFAKDHALKVFARHSLACKDISSCSISSDLDALLGNFSPSFILTSATSLPWLDMTERYLWKWGQSHNIPTMGVIDQWQNYALRFSGTHEDERLAYLPDYICTLDLCAKEHMIAEGIPEDRIFVTGQPAFDAILHYQREFFESGKKIHEILGIDRENNKIIIFVSEVVFRDFQSNLGYTEVDALRILLDTLMTESRLDKINKYTLIIKLHPQNIREDFCIIDFEKYRNFFDIIWVGTELPPRDVVMIADIVIGMASILLVESILLNKLTISLQPNAINDDNLIATKIGAIPLIREKEEFRRLFHLLLTHDNFRLEYLTTETKLRVDGHAANRVNNYIERILGRRT